jgi:hypothetical protein
MTATPPDKIKISDINPFGLRMQPELKSTLEREADINGRSLNAEIVNRLQLSIERQRTGVEKSYKSAEPAAPAYLAKDDHERAMLNVFRRMSPEKQLALLSLFK